MQVVLNIFSNEALMLLYDYDRGLRPILYIRKLQLYHEF